MRVMHSDLAILNATQYDAGPSFRRGRITGGPKKTDPSPRDEAGSKKRPRVAPADEPAQADQAEPEEEKKRARGRPRLDPTDQTPQDVSCDSPHLPGVSPFTEDGVMR
jgi:hypothetical protein